MQNSKLGGWGTKSPSDLKSPRKTTELSSIKLKTGNSITHPHGEWAFSPLDFRASCLSHLALVIYMFVVNFMVWQREAVFGLKEDKLSSDEYRIRSWEICDTNSPLNWRSTHKPTDLSRIKLKSLKSRACSHDDWAFSPLDYTVGWLSTLVMYMFVSVNVYCLAQESDFRIEMRQVVFLCWMQDSKLGSLRHQIACRLKVNSQTD